MPLNVMGHPDRRRYNPSRDVAYIWPNLMKVALEGLKEGLREPICQSLVDKYKLDDKALGEAAAKYAKLFEVALKQGDLGIKTAEEALKLCGFFDLSEGQQAVILTRLGQVMTGAFFYAVRDTYVETNDPPYDDAKIAELASKAQESFTNRTRKWYHKLFSWFTRKG
jgi:hypothetical protein